MQVKSKFIAGHLAIQQGASNCGPTSLQNILQDKGNFDYTEQELAYLCNSKLGYGTTTQALEKAAEKLGLKIITSQEHGTIKNLEHYLDLDAYVVICYTNAFSGNSHYTCLVEYDQEAFYCYDPAFGLFCFWKKYLVKFWHGQPHDASCNNQQWFMALK